MGAGTEMLNEREESHVNFRFLASTTESTMRPPTELRKTSKETGLW